MAENLGKRVGGTIVWFRQDLRLRDNPALHAACERGGWVLPLYILDEDAERDWPLGGASRWWLHQSLSLLAASLDQRGSRLVVLRGDAQTLLPRLSARTGAAAVYWNRRYEPAMVERDARLKSALRESGIACESFNGALLAEPWNARSPADKPYRVFTPFKKRLLEQLQVAAISDTPRRIIAPDPWPRSQTLQRLGLMPRIPWYRGMAQHWQPGETGALQRARRFLAHDLDSYGEARNRPGMRGTSELSPHLHFGEVSVRQLWQLGVQACARARRAAGCWQESVFASELVWREFAHHLLYYFPRTPLHPLDTRFERFAWQRNKQRLHAWQRGLTGFPIVDAGMRQLWSIGWMHNRVRMIVASLLVKNLQQPWLDGARWFWDTLVDADLAANTLNWQWTAGCGADAAPYFRVFNPVTQGQKFDPDGEYVRRWVPELARLPARYIHAPQLAPAEVLHAAQVRLGDTYPLPLVDLKASRQAALQAYATMRQAQGLT